MSLTLRGKPGSAPGPAPAPARTDRPAAKQTAASRGDVLRYWLHLQCSTLGGCARAVVLKRDATGGAFQPAATWPIAATPTSDLRNAATRAIRNRRAIVMPTGPGPENESCGGHIAAYPLQQNGEIRGVLVVEFGGRIASPQRTTVRKLELCAAGMTLALSPTDPVLDTQARRVIDIVASSVEHLTFDAASRSAMSRLATMGRYDQVTLGLLRRGRAQISAVSGRANVDPRMRVARVIGLAMDEAIAQDTTLVLPGHQRDGVHALTAHANLLATRGCGAVCTVPVTHGAQLVGAVLFEHADAEHFNAETIAFCEATVALIGPILFDKHLQYRGPFEKLSSAVNTAARSLGNTHNRWRGFATAILAGVIALPFIANGHYRVTADASLEGALRRIIAAPVDGFVAESPIRPGDIVERGQLLARLDDRDLELERLKWSSDKNQLQREYREAMAEHDSTRVAILRARLDRATAQLGLTEERIARARIMAPMAGIVVAGDLSKSLGAPVEKGQNLFEITPLDAYRVTLEVDERDIAQLTPGQTGRLALVGLPDRHLAFHIERITPIAKQAEGQNFFTVEARLNESPELLRPGMDGVGKIDVGERRLAWIWTHRLLDWLRLRVWTWFG